MTCLDTILLSLVFTRWSQFYAIAGSIRSCFEEYTEFFKLNFVRNLQTILYNLDKVLYRANFCSEKQFHSLIRVLSGIAGDFVVVHVRMATLTECAFCDTLVIFLSLFATLYLWMKWKHTYWQRRGVPTVPAHWFFGHFKDVILLRRPAGTVLKELHQVAGENDVLGIYILHKPFLLLRNPELIKQIMIRDFNVFPNHHFKSSSTTDTVGQWTLFTIDNPEWKYLR